MKPALRSTKRSRGHVPVRTCVACGAKRPKHALLRLVLSESGEIQVDREMIRSGRGAYLCDCPECREKFVRSRKPGRVFRTAGTVRCVDGLLNEA